MDVRMMVVGALLCLASLEARAAPPCDGFDQAIEASLKEIAYQTAMGVADNSAPRESSRQARIANELQLIQIHLDLAARNQCPVRRAPINEAKYLSEALSCQVAIVRGDKDPASCKRESWSGFKPTS